MHVILVRDVERLGKAGQEVVVKDGYARNFLIPRGLALLANAASRSQVKAIQSVHVRHSEAAKAKAEQVADRLLEIACTITVSVGEQGKLHGAVTVGDIVGVLQRQGVFIEKHQVVLPGPIIHLGVHHVPVKLHPEVVADLKVSVIPG